MRRPLLALRTWLPSALLLCAGACEHNPDFVADLAATPSAGTNAQILLENNAFIGVKTPQEFNNTADMGTSYITATNNVYTGVSGGQATGGGGTPFTNPGYAYTLDAGSAVQAAVQAGAGPR